MSETILAADPRPTIRLAALPPFSASRWPWRCGTSRRRAGDGVSRASSEEGVEIGIEQVRTRRDLWFDRMLIQPLRGPASGHAPAPGRTTKEPAE